MADVFFLSNTGTNINAATFPIKEEATTLNSINLFAEDDVRRRLTEGGAMMGQHSGVFNHIVSKEDVSGVKLFKRVRVRPKEETSLALEDLVFICEGEILRSDRSY